VPNSSPWDEYYGKIEGRAPRQLLLDALKSFPDDPAPFARQAIDLGCGDGTETAVLLERGWEVLAVDGEPAAIGRLLKKVPPQGKAHLRTQVAKFKDVLLTPADLIHASLSIPFCEPPYFTGLWDKIVSATRRGGRFAGQFFGRRDSWVANKDMTFLTEAQTRSLFGDFEIESFVERDEDGEATSGPKHWHIFTVIARKV
jgi:tellurite methyltransferase